MKTTRARFAARLLIALAVVVTAGVTLTPSIAQAASGSGWIRLAHLSPDTPAVNVALTSVGDSRTMLKLSDVGYGSISAYQKVPAGRYVATMTPAGGTAKSTPAISQAVNVVNGRAYTVAAVGTNAQLRGVVLDDDLRTPKAGSARVRLLQASASTPSATVTAVGGPVLAQDATFGSSTGYATIKSGVWTVQIAAAGASGKPTEAKLTATPGSVNTIIVLDRRGGGVQAKIVRDAAAAPAMPKKGKGVETGGGGTATDFVDVTPVVAANPSAVGRTSTGALVLVGAALLALIVPGRRLVTASRRVFDRSTGA